METTTTTTTTATTHLTYPSVFIRQEANSKSLNNIALERKRLQKQNGLQKRKGLQERKGLHYRNIAFKRDITPKISIMIFMSLTGHGVALEE